MRVVGLGGTSVVLQRIAGNGVGGVYTGYMAGAGEDVPGSSMTVGADNAAAVGGSEH